MADLNRGLEDINKVCSVLDSRIRVKDKEITSMKKTHNYY